MQQRETVNTWADGFGRWHARVTFPSPGYDPAQLAAHAARIRVKARRHIRRALVQRGEAGSGWPCRVELAANDLNHMNVMRSLTFRER